MFNVGAGAKVSMPHTLGHARGLFGPTHPVMRVQGLEKRSAVVGYVARAEIRVIDNFDVRTAHSHGELRLGLQVQLRR